MLHIDKTTDTLLAIQHPPEYVQKHVRCDATPRLRNKNRKNSEKSYKCSHTKCKETLINTTNTTML